MKLIIDISKEDFEIMKHNVVVDNPLCPINQKDMVIKIANGIPLDDLRTKIEEVKTARFTTDDAMIEASANVIINPQYRNFTSGLDMAIYIIDKYMAERNK